MISYIIRIVLALVPLIVALLFDFDLSSQAHIPVIGIAGICVALCDALCGQIISNTRWIPFSACYKPSEAQEMASRFRSYHKEMFQSWMIAKVCSAISITLSAVMLLQEKPHLLQDYQNAVFMFGYGFLGVSVVTAIEFIKSYFSAIEESDTAKLRELNYLYEKEQEELSRKNQEAVKEQLKDFGAGYTSPPVVAKQV